MRILKSVICIFLTILSFYINNKLFAQLKGSLRYEEIKGFERSVTKNPCIRIKSIHPDLKFAWSGGKTKIMKKDGEWIIFLRPGLQTLYVSADNFESLDIKLDLRKYEVKIFRIKPIIKQFYLKIETNPDSARVMLKDDEGNKLVKGLSPFEYYSPSKKYNLHVSRIGYNSIDTTIVFKNNPIKKLNLDLDKTEKYTKDLDGGKLKSESLTKVDSIVAVTDSIGIRDNKLKLKKLLKIACTATVSVWLASEIIFNKRKKEKSPQLPGVPDFPRP